MSEKINSILFIVIAILLLLPLIGVDSIAPIDGWLVVVAFAVMGILGLMKGGSQ